MKSRLNSPARGGGQGSRQRATIAGVSLCAALACTTSTTPFFPNGLSSFQVVATDKSNAIWTFPHSAVEVHLDATALDNSGNLATGYNGFAEVFVTPGLILTQFGPSGQFSSTSDGGDNPTIQFQNGRASIDAWAIKVFGDAVFIVQDVSGGDAGSGNNLQASGASNPLHYAYPLIQDTQITSVNIYSPLNGSYVVFDEHKPRCLAPPADGGACDPTQLYYMDMMVSSVGDNYFTVLDLNAYKPDSGYPGAPNGFDPNTGLNDLPGTWATMFVYTYQAPTLFVGDRLSQLQGTMQEFAGDTQLNFPTYILSADSRNSAARPQDLPPPMPINPDWCIPRDIGGLPADATLCETSITDIKLESLESGLVSLRNATMPSRFLDCNLNGTGKINYRTASGCMPQTGGNFCYDGGGGAACLAGEDCIADECLVQCATDADCILSDSEACIDGHCQNPCMCRQYCDSVLTCTEKFQYDTYGQYNVLFPGSDGGLWKFGTITKTGVPSFNPFTSPGMVVDYSNGILEQVDAADPSWLIVPRDPADLCCHADSPGCNGDAGLAICPKPSSP